MPLGGLTPADTSLPPRRFALPDDASLGSPDHNTDILALRTVDAWSGCNLVRVAGVAICREDVAEPLMVAGKQPQQDGVELLGPGSGVPLQ